MAGKSVTVPPGVGTPECGTDLAAVSRVDAASARPPGGPSGHRSRTWYSGAGPVTDSTSVISPGVHAGPSWAARVGTTHWPGQGRPVAAQPPDGHVRPEPTVGHVQAGLQPACQLGQPGPVLDSDPDHRPEGSGSVQADRFGAGQPVGAHSRVDACRGLRRIRWAEERQRDVPPLGRLPAHIGCRPTGLVDRLDEGLPGGGAGPDGDEQPGGHGPIIASPRTGGDSPRLRLGPDPGDMLQVSPVSGDPDD